MTRYSLGFCFIGEEVVLIRKNKPAWQKDKLNGVGGKVEDYETPQECMRREFLEETGVDIPCWLKFTVMKFQDVEVHCFATNWSRSEPRPHTTTDEEIVIGSADHREHCPLRNLDWLIPMARAILDDPESNDVPHTLDHE